MINLLKYRITCPLAHPKEIWHSAQVDGYPKMSWKGSGGRQKEWCNLGLVSAAMAIFSLRRRWSLAVQQFGAEPSFGLEAGSAHCERPHRQRDLRHSRPAMAVSVRVYIVAATLPRQCNAGRKCNIFNGSFASLTYVGFWAAILDSRPDRLSLSTQIVPMDDGQRLHPPSVSATPAATWTVLLVGRLLRVHAGSPKRARHFARAVA